MYRHWKETGEGLWIRRDSASYKVGITQDLLNQCGDISFIDLLNSGDFKKGEAFLHLESQKAVHELEIPLSGEISIINNKVFDYPELLNGLTWIAVIKNVNGNEFHQLNDYQPKGIGRDVG